jgi:hypothetical protein
MVEANHPPKDIVITPQKNHIAMDMIGIVKFPFFSALVQGAKQVGCCVKVLLLAYGNFF